MAGRGRVGLKDVARAAGTSHVSVWNAFNAPHKVSHGLRVRVERAAAELGYAGAQGLGRALRTGRAEAVGLCSPDPLDHLFEDPAAALFMAGVAARLQAAGKALVVLPGPSPHGADHGASLAAEAALVDGYVLYGMPQDDPTVWQLAGRGSACVLVDAELDGASGVVARVGIDERAAARGALEHLLDLGHRRVAVLAMEVDAARAVGPVRSTAVECSAYDVTRLRWRGQREALEAAGLAPLALLTAPSLPEAAQEAVGPLLDRPAETRPTAVACMSDQAAIGVLRAAGAAGLRVPRDLSVMGFDDVPAARWAAQGGLSTVRQPLREKGERAAAALLEPAAAPVGPLLTELVVRGSTGPAPSGA